MLRAGSADYRLAMVLLCIIGRHQPSTVSISLRRGGGYKGICETCAMPLEHDGKGKWREATPLCLQAGTGTRR